VDGNAAGRGGGIPVGYCVVVGHVEHVIGGFVSGGGSAVSWEEDCTFSKRW
jgi:hypothetical protein